MNQEKHSIRYIVEGALIAAIYVVLTIAFAPISFGVMQIRVAEILTILPLFTPAAVPGLFLGCLLGNLLGGAVILDIFFGSLATLIGAWLGYLLRFNRWLVPIPTVISNTVIIPLVLRYGYGTNIPLPMLALYIAAGEIAGSYILGELLAAVLIKRFPRFRAEK